MSTIPVNPVDASKPQTGNNPPPSTTDQRLAHANINAAFGAARNDVEALESGKVDEAPIDGQEYVRKDAAWSLATQGTIDHGALNGLADDDHPQYHNNARGDARYAPLGHVGSAGTAHANATGSLAGFMSPGDKSKLDGIPGNAAEGDMLKSVYDPDDDGIVNAAADIVAIGTNGSGSIITAGTFVQADVGGSISPAEPSPGQWAIGAANADIANGAPGQVVIDGLIGNLNTSAAATGDPIYLTANGGWTPTLPTDQPYQQIGTIWRSDAVLGSIIVNPQEVVEPDAEGSTGVLLLTEAAQGTHFHNNTSLTTWSEIVPGAGQTLVAQTANMVAGTNPGRIRFDYSGTLGPQPDPAGINGIVSLQISIEFPTANSFLEVAPAINGVVAAAELAGYAAIGGNQVIGTAIPFAISFPLIGLSDGDELSIVTRGFVDAGYLIHTMSVSFVSAEGAGAGGGGGGVTDHTALTGRSASDSHPISAITLLQQTLDAKALNTDLTAHVSNASGAHAASAVSVTPIGGLAATNAQAGFAELDSELSSHVGSGGAEHAAATGATAGFMSAADKTILDAHVGAGGAAHANANGTTAGFMTAADFNKLTGIATGANNYAHPNHTGEVTSTGDGAQVISSGVVSNTKLSSMAGYTIKMRNNAASGAPTDTKVSGLTVLGSLSAGDVFMGESAGGVLAQIDSSIVAGVSAENTTPGLLKLAFVSALPSTPDPNTIYFIP